MSSRWDSQSWRDSKAMPASNADEYGLKAEELCVKKTAQAIRRPRLALLLPMSNVVTSYTVTFLCPLFDGCIPLQLWPQ